MKIYIKSALRLYKKLYKIYEFAFQFIYNLILIIKLIYIFKNSLINDS